MDKSDGRTKIPPVRESLLGPAGLALAAVLVLCVVAPPEIRGSGLAATAFFVCVAVVAASATAAASPASRWVFAMVPLGLVAIRTAIAPGEAVEPAVCMLLAAFAGISAAHAAEHDEFFAWLFGALAAYAGGRALFAGYSGLKPSGAAALSGFLIMTLPAVAAWALGKRGRTRALGLAAGALGAGGLVATRSVPAIAALAAALALAGLRGRVVPRTLAVGTAAFGLAVLGVGIARPDANVRAALEIARDHPLAGVGPGGFAEAFPQYRSSGDDESRHANDLPAELAAEWGVPVGLALSAVFFWLFVGPVVRRENDAFTLSSGLKVGVAAFALHNLAGLTAFLPSLLVCAAVCRGLLARRVARDRAVPAERAAWVAIALALAVVAAGSGLARDALSDARDKAASGDHAAALRLALLASALAPWDADPPLFACGRRMAAGSSVTAALEDAERAVERAPSQASARSVRARARSAAGDSTGAYADLVEASRLDPLRAEYASQRDALAAALVRAGEAAPR